MSFSKHIEKINAAKALKEKINNDSDAGTLRYSESGAQNITADEYIGLLSTFDEYYMYSDDIRVFKSGAKHERMLKEIVKVHPDYKDLEVPSTIASMNDYVMESGKVVQAYLVGHLIEAGIFEDSTIDKVLELREKIKALEIELRKVHYRKSYVAVPTLDHLEFHSNLAYVQFNRKTIELASDVRRLHMLISHSYPKLNRIPYFVTGEVETKAKVNGTVQDVRVNGLILDQGFYIHL